MSKARPWLGIFLLPALLLAASPTVAAHELVPPEGGFALPLDCDFQEACLVQHYVDRDPTEGARDYRCGGNTYDSHQGSDLRLRTWAAMIQGVPVLAAAGGIVRKAEDGAPDRLSDPQDPGESLAEINGNHLVIDHGAGWQTQYNHLRRNSLKVRSGDRVERGQMLGLVGLSGASNFPHLHFTVIFKSRVLDPFSATPVGADCHETGAVLWHLAAAAQLPYRQGGPLEAGFAMERPEAERIRRGAYRTVGELPLEAPLIAFWATAWGLQRGDRESLSLAGPAGQSLADREETLKDDRGESSTYIGIKRRTADWPPGAYRGSYKVERQQEGRWITLFQVQKEVELRAK